MNAPVTLPRSVAAPGELSPERLAGVYNAIMQNIAREDSNSHNRIMWALSLTSGQFLAISIFMNRLKDGSEWTVISLFGELLLPGLGVFYCFRTRRDVAAAHRQIEHLKGEYNRRKPQFDALGLPRPFGESAPDKPGGSGTSGHGGRSCVTYVQALFVIWLVILAACLGGLGYVAVYGAPKGEAERSVTPAPSVHVVDRSGADRSG